MTVVISIPQYDIEAFTQDIVDGQSLLPAKKGAAYTAAIKKRKRQIIIEYLIIQEDINEWDLTPTLVRKFAKDVMGRGVSWTDLLSIFGEENRDASRKSHLFEHYEKTFKSHITVVKRKVNVEGRRCLSIIYNIKGVTVKKRTKRAKNPIKKKK